MGLITEILSFVRGSGDTDTAFGCETALSRLQAERATASEAIAGASARRRAALLNDASDKEIAGLDKEVDSHHLTLERLELIEGDLVGRLQALRSDQRKVQFQKILKRYFAASTAYVDAHRAATRAMGAVTAIHDEANAAGFGHEISAHYVFPTQILDMAQIAVYEDAVERISDAVAGRAKPQPVQVARRPFVDLTPSEPASARAVRLGHVQPNKVGDGALRTPREPRVDVAKKGERLVRLLRQGYEAPDGEQCNSGDIIALQAATATVVVRNRAAEFVMETQR